MFLSGTIQDFENRLHQLPETTGDLTTGFLIEARGYLASGTGIISVQQSGKLEREARKRKFLITTDTTTLSTQQL